MRRKWKAEQLLNPRQTSGISGLQVLACALACARSSDGPTAGRSPRPGPAPHHVGPCPRQTAPPVPPSGGRARAGALKLQGGAWGRCCAARPSPRLGECGTGRAGAPRGASISRGAAGAALRPRPCASGPPEPLRAPQHSPTAQPRRSHPLLSPDPDPRLPGPCRGPSAPPGCRRGGPWRGSLCPRPYCARLPRGMD